MVEKDDTIIEGKRETAELDWPRIRHLMKLGLIAGCMNLAGDLLLGYGVSDPSQAGLAGMLSAYVRLSDARIFWSSFLGFIGIPLEGLCCFAIYRLIKPYSESTRIYTEAGSSDMLPSPGVACMSLVWQAYSFTNT